MKTNDDRFIRVHKQSTMSGYQEIWVDRMTGVNYLFISRGYGAGLTPLLDAQGKPVVTPLPRE